MILFLISTLFVSCNKDDAKFAQSKTEIRDSFSITEQNLTQYNSIDERHSIVAKTLSVFFKKPSVRLAFDSYTRAKGNSVVLLADFLYNEVIDDSILRNEFPTSTGTTLSISLCDLINEYLKDYPELEISFVKETNDDYPDIVNDGNFETVSVYSDIDSFPIYKDGLQIGMYSENDEPTDKTILKLQTSDVYDVIKINNLSGVNSNNKYADLLSCIALKSMINGMPFIGINTKSIGGCVFKNPLGGTKVITFKDIYNFFNENCGIPDGFPLDDDPSVEPRNTCDRDVLRNGRETIFDVRGNNGKTIFRSCDTWCSYWNTDCTFQVDVFIPTIAAAEGEYDVLGSIVRVFSLNEKRLRNGWNTKKEIPVTEWLYLEGKHGDEWQYTWTGRHRKRGTSSETTIGLGLSSKVGFNIKGVSVELGRTGNISTKVTRANEDCPLGSDISRYCRSLPEQLHLGDIDFKVTEK